ncbi:MAG: ATP-binding protein, partial [Deltaproteobacteria bacterium]|nr:ATP-binding protein [Deltaproteobacteria bacterium]
SEKMKQVILNLLFNAVESLHDKGKIEISTSLVNCNGNIEGENIQIEIKDNGPGISQDVLDKIFDPYFTTKHKSGMHNGTGLGLSIAYQNMLEHSGIIEVDSNINEGTTFKVTLPHNHSKIEQNMDLR